jgi:deoxyribose-phosphate aldolase
LQEAKIAIQNGVDEIDFVCNYEAFKAGDTEVVKEEVIQGIQTWLRNAKIVKWIIEAAVLDKQIIQIATLIKKNVISNFESQYCSVFL